MNNSTKINGLKSLFLWCRNRGSIKAESENVYQQVAEQFLNLRDGNIEPGDWQALQQSSTDSEQHARIMTRLDQLWGDMEQLHELPWPTERECHLDQYDGEQALQAAGNKASKEPLTETSIDRGSRQIYNNSTIANWFQLVSLSGAAVAVLLAVFYLWPISPVSPVYRTDIGEHRLITLQDGSEVLLGAKSVLRVVYSTDVRQLSLDLGEALFTVAKDETRPFIVSSGSASVVAVGTQFNVHRLVDDVVISVIEGVVNVSTEPIASYIPEKRIQVVTTLSGSLANNPLRTGTTQLSDGQQLRLNDRHMVSDIQKVVSDDVLSWQDGRLVYSGDPLSTVIADVNRYNNRPIRIADNEIKQLMFSGTVRKGEIEDWLNGLQSVFGFEVVFMEKNIVIMNSKEK